MKHKRLLPYKNPLCEKLGTEFFKTVPMKPGVYFMTSKSGAVVYIGKSKNLRDRLNSYRNTKPENVSRKVLRLLKAIHSIRWEVCETERLALLLENKLLREHRPKFNLLNTRPDLYYFFFVCVRSTAIEFRLSTKSADTADILPELEQKGTLHQFGAFRGRFRTRESFKALLRILWAAYANAKPSSFFPTLLTRTEPLFSFTLPRGHFKDSFDQVVPLILSFLSGKSEDLLPFLMTPLLEQVDMPKFVIRIVQEDLSYLKEFYRVSTNRNRQLIEKHQGNYGLNGDWIAQAQLDDLLVLSSKKSE